MSKKGSKKAPVVEAKPARAALSEEERKARREARRAVRKETRAKAREGRPEIRKKKWTVAIAKEEIKALGMEEKIPPSSVTEENLAWVAKKIRVQKRRIFRKEHKGGMPPWMAGEKV